MIVYCEHCGKEFNSTHKRNKYCSRECYRDAYKHNAMADFIQKFNNKYEGRYTYVAGYGNSEDYIQCKCLKCGGIITRRARTGRQGGTYNIKCPYCASTEANNKKEQQKIKKEQGKISKAKARQDKQNKRLLGQCKECGNTFKGERAGLCYCSDECRRKHSNRYHEINRRGKIKKNGTVDYSISLQRLVKRDKYICHICGKTVDMAADTNASTYGSIDHVIPISKGGTHTWDNVMLAHRDCNTAKRDNSLYVMRGDLIMLA